MSVTLNQFILLLTAALELLLELLVSLLLLGGTNFLLDVLEEYEETGHEKEQGDGAHNHTAYDTGTERTVTGVVGGMIVGTIGWNDIKDEVIDYFKSRGTTMIYASNFSLGVNVMFSLVAKASTLLANAGYDPYIVEMHHKHKLDAPSGTAKSLAQIVDNATGAATQVQSVRCGEIAGIHTVGFEGANDRITITHEAFSRKGFAQGAVEAALMTEKITGVHEFKDIII